MSDCDESHPDEHKKVDRLWLVVMGDPSADPPTYGILQEVRKMRERRRYWSGLGNTMLKAAISVIAVSALGFLGLALKHEIWPETQKVDVQGVVNVGTTTQP